MKTPKLNTNGFSNVARSIARSLNVTVEFRNDETAWTNGEKIVLPHIKDSFDKQDVLLGYLVHECSHVLNTNFKTDNKHFTNLLEDHRIERMIRSKYLGAENFLVKTWESVLDDMEISELSSTPFGAASNYLLLHCQVEVMGRKVPSELLNAVKDKIVDVFGVDLTPGLDKLALKSRYTTSTDDCLSLSNEIMEYLLSFQPENSNNSQGEDDEGDDQNQDSSGDNQSEGDEGDDQTQDSKGDDQSENDEGGSQNQDSNGKKLSDAQASLKNCNEVSDDLKDLLEEQIKEILKENSNLLSQPTYSENNVGSFNEFPAHDESVLAQASKAGGKAKSALKQILESVSRDRQITKRKGNKLSSRHLTRASVGNPNIFSKKIHGRGLDAAVTVAVDLSGSMGGGQDELALASSMAVVDAINTSKGMTARMTIFPGYINPCSQVVPRGQRPDKGISGLKAHGGTPIWEALYDAVDELKSVKADKKVVFIATDGEFSNHQELESYLTNNNVEGFWIGINTLKLPFKNSVNITSADELGDKMKSFIIDNIL